MRVNEIFYSLQGEGYHSGCPAVFVRLSGCNMRCPFCDTSHEEGTDMDESEIADTVGRWPAQLVVVTGGEPALQLTDTLVDRLHAMDCIVAVETNGTHALPANVDWVTCSPKDIWIGPQAAPVIDHADELKLLFDGQHEPRNYDGIRVNHRYLQPMDTGDPQCNAQIMSAAVDYVKQNPQWTLSLQLHKILNIR